MNLRWLLVLIVVVLAFRLHHGWRHYTNAAPPADASDADVVLYTSDHCGDPCDASVDFLVSQNIRHRVINVDHDSEARGQLRNAGGGVPMVVDGARVWSGYDPDFLEQWYLRRSANRQQLEKLGLESAGERSIPILFGTSWCGYCRMTRQYFRAHNIPFRDIDIEQVPGAGAMEQQLFGGNPLPGIVYADMLYAGYSDQLLDALRKWTGDATP